MTNRQASESPLSRKAVAPRPGVVIDVGPEPRDDQTHNYKTLFTLARKSERRLGPNRLAQMLNDRTCLTGGGQSQRDASAALAARCDRPGKHLDGARACALHTGSSGRR